MMLRSSLKSWYVRGIQINVIAGGVGVASAFIAIMARLCAFVRALVHVLPSLFSSFLNFIWYFRWDIMLNGWRRCACVASV